MNALGFFDRFSCFFAVFLLKNTLKTDVLRICFLRIRKLKNVDKIKAVGYN